MTNLPNIKLLAMCNVLVIAYLKLVLIWKL